MQRPVIIESASPAAPATLYCNASTHAAVAPIVSICGSAQLTIRNVIIEGCDDRTFLFGNNRFDDGGGGSEVAVWRSPVYTMKKTVKMRNLP